MPSSYARRIERVINNKGELVDVIIKEQPTYSDYGDLVSSTDKEIRGVKAVFNQYGLSSEYVTEGQFQSGDVSFFFKAGQTGLFNGNLIRRKNGELWKITSTYKNAVGGVESHTECRVTNHELP